MQQIKENKYLIPATNVKICRAKDSIMFLNVLTGQNYILESEFYKLLYKEVKEVSLLSTKNKQHYKSLLDCGLLEQCDRLSFEDVVKVHTTEIYSNPKITGIGLSSASIQITNDCDLNCNFCHNVVNRSCGCNRYNKGTDLSSNIIEETIEQLITMGVKRITLMGGNVALIPLKLKNIFNTFKNCDVEFEITLNGLSLSDDFCTFLEKFNVSVKLVQFIAEGQQLHELVGIDNYKEKFMVGLLKLKQYSINLSSYFILDSQFSSDKIIKKVPENAIINYIFRNPQIQAEKLMQAELFKHYSLTNYQLREEFNSCLLGTLYISSNGGVYSCSGILEKPYGVISNKYSLHQILIDSGNELLEQTKKPEACKNNCIYNSICSRCVVLAANIKHCKEILNG